MAPKLVLVYFDITGIAESIRWALVLSGLEWEDKRLPRDEARFSVLKPTLPNGQLPILEVDGYPLPQTMAILRYVGKLGGLYPTDDFEAAKCDAVMDSTVDLVVIIRSYLYEKDEAKKMEILKKIVADSIPTWLGNMEKQLGQTEGLYFHDKMTVADLAVAARIWGLKSGELEGIPKTIVDAYPKLVALADSITAKPEIAEYLAKIAASK